MAEVGVCNQCGLPKDLCVCESIAREQQKITIKIERRKFGKKYAIIEGLEEVNLEEIARKLKIKLACGGTSKHGRIELQGGGGITPTEENMHKRKIKKLLTELGFAPETIELK